MKKTLVSLVLVLPVLLVGCAAVGPDGKPEPSVSQLVANAEMQYKAAEEQGIVWNTTEKNIETAKKAKDELEVDKAIKAAKKALKEIKLAQEQAKASADIKPTFN